MNVYRYKGPVKKFNQVISSEWIGETSAISEKSAKNNLVYQYKKTHNLAAATKISLPGSLELVV